MRHRNIASAVILVIFAAAACQHPSPVNDLPPKPRAVGDLDPVEMVRAATYLAVSVFAGLAGYLLASFSGGAALNMGAEYLLMSIVVVVIGGTSIAGGASNVRGIWGAALFMFLVVSMLNSYGAGAGVRSVLTGTIIIAIVIAASTRRVRA